MANTDTTSGTVRRAAPDLPALGYPVAEDAVEHWFQQRYKRLPTEQELGAIMGEMAQREATPPHHGPNATEQGWVTGPAVPPTRG
jgi:hypothetical protein